MKLIGKAKYIILGLLVTICVFTSCKMQVTVTFGKQKCEPCKPSEQSEPYNSSAAPTDTDFICTQAYYTTDETSVAYTTNPHINYDGNRPCLTMNCWPRLQSSIWTNGGYPGFGRFYLNFDLNDYNATKKTQILNTSLYLYSYPTSHGHSSNTETNRHVFNRVIEEWKENAITWNNQPNIDETTSIITDHIPGTIDNPSREPYVFNMNDILLKDGKLLSDYKGICCRPYKEDIEDYYRRMTFTHRSYGDKAYLSTLKVEYAIPQPEIKFMKNVFSVTNNEDLKAIFKDVQYVWTINDAEYTGESVNCAIKAKRYNVALQIVVTNNIGEICKFNMSKTFK
jgi:hypothetical protein